MSEVNLSGLVKRYETMEVIHGIDLHIEEGEFCVFVDPSGCGKSTFLRMVAGLEEISQGHISIGARDVTRLDPAERGVAEYCSAVYTMVGEENCYEFKPVWSSGLNDPGDHTKAQNVAMETFFKTIKTELIWRHSWQTHQNVEVAIFEYINDGVDAPPGGIAMCQNGRSLNCHQKGEHPWRMLA